MAITRSQAKEVRSQAEKARPQKEQARRPKLILKHSCGAHCCPERFRVEKPGRPRLILRHTCGPHCCPERFPPRRLPRLIALHPPKPPAQKQAMLEQEHSIVESIKKEEGFLKVKEEDREACLASEQERDCSVEIKVESED